MKLREAAASATSGWSAGVLKRWRRWLYSVDWKACGEDGSVAWSVTLTLRDLPGSHVAWQRLLTLYRKRVVRLGAVRWCWCVEWQRRGVPHLHAVVFLPADVLGGSLVDAWLSVARDFRPGRRGQKIDRMDDRFGWQAYLSAHAARGTKHEQRKGLPPGWDRSGKVWSVGGDWLRFALVEVAPEDGGRTVSDDACDAARFGEWRMLKAMNLAHVRASRPAPESYGGEHLLRGAWWFPKGKQELYRGALASWKRRMAHARRMGRPKRAVKADGCVWWRQVGIDCWLPLRYWLAAYCHWHGSAVPLVDLHSGEVRTALEWLAYARERF